MSNRESMDLGAKGFRSVSMRHLAAFFALSVVLCAHEAFAQSREEVALTQLVNECKAVDKNSATFHADVWYRARNVRYESPTGIEFEMLVQLIGIPNTGKVNALRLLFCRAIGLNNASAGLHKDFRYIFVDTDWAASASGDFYLTLGHELGHHFCEHTIGKPRSSPWDTELEADRFGGASIKRLEVYHGRGFIREVMAEANNKYSETGSPSHPPRMLRLQALKQGYEEGSPCNSLVAAIRGFTPPYQRFPMNR